MTWWRRRPYGRARMRRGWRSEQRLLTVTDMACVQLVAHLSAASRRRRRLCAGGEVLCSAALRTERGRPTPLPTPAATIAACLSRPRPGPRRPLAAKHRCARCRRHCRRLLSRARRSSPVLADVPYSLTGVPRAYHDPELRRPRRPPALQRNSSHRTRATHPRRNIHYPRRSSLAAVRPACCRAVPRLF